ncbi:hypothetical protein CsatB_016889 [Cannabis sativa]
MDIRKVAAIVEAFTDHIRKFNELKDDTDEDSAKLDAAVLKMRKSGKFIKSNAVNAEYVLSLHLHDEKMLYKEYDGSPFDLDLFDIGKDENDRLLHQVCQLEYVLPKTILNRSSLKNFFGLNQHMDALMKYVMEPNLPPDQIIFLGEKVVARRCDFKTLGEDKLVAPRVVNCLVEILTAVERFEHHEEQFFWWIPTMLSRPEPRSHETLSEPGKWKEWCGAIQICQKVYVPMVIKRQWSLSVLVMKLKKANVYDNFSICSTPSVDNYGYIVIFNG